MASRQATVSLFDRGFLYGDGLFETLRAYRGQPFLLDEHLHRLRTSAEALGIRAQLGRARLGRALAQLIAANGFSYDDCTLRVILTRGPARPGLLPPRRSSPTLAALAIPLDRRLGHLQRQGIEAVLFDVTASSGRLLGCHKTLDYLPAILARMHAWRLGAREAIYVGRGGAVLEGATSNVFAVLDGALVTPPARGILPGITRDLVIELAQQLELRVVKRKVTRRELLGAREVFLTASVVEILPVSRLEGRRLPVGEVTRSLQERYRQRVRASSNQ